MEMKSNLGVKILMGFVAGWLVAQVLKYIIYITGGRQEKKGFWEIMRKSGGMPSGHTASLVAAMMVIGMGAGWGSVEFALMFCFTSIVIYDAVNVRWVVGEHGKVLNEVAKKNIRVVEGHVVREVIAGAILGVGIGWLVYLGCNF